MCNETVPCFEGRNGFPCLANNHGKFYQNILPSTSNCVQHFTLPTSSLSSPLKTAVSIVHFIAAIIIRPSVYCTGRVTFCRFHIIFIEFRPVINAITYIIRQYQFTNTLGNPCISWVQATHNGRYRVLSQIQIAKNSKTNEIWSTKPNPQTSKKQLKKLLRSIYCIFKEGNDQKSRVSERYSATTGGCKERKILWYSLFVTRGFIYLHVCENNLI